MEEIKYKEILHYLESNGAIEYKNPKTPGLSEDEIDNFLKVKDKGRTVVAEIKKIANYFADEYGLNECEIIRWLDGAQQRTSKFLCAPMKYKSAKYSPISISLFVENIGGVVGYRVCLDIKVKDVKDEVIENYHRHLDMEKMDGIEYTSLDNSESNLIVLTESVDDIKKKIENGELKKVQLSICIPTTADKADKEYGEEINIAVKKLIPYYERVVGKTKNRNSGLKVSDTYKNEIEVKSKKKTYGKNMILYGPPGTGKTYTTAIYAVAICDNETIETVSDREYNDVMRRYRRLLKDGRISFTTFHQSYCYEEFIEGIKPNLNETGDIGYKIEDGLFKSFCNTAEALPNKNYIFVIDEINRGNISKIFGELITLIEEAKRKGMKEEMSTRLPYSKKFFSVPANVYILGTMNTADRSLALMDTALRRRFQFIEMQPDASVLKGIEVEGLNIAEMLKTINERMALLYDREHTIGHAFFTKLKNDPSKEMLQTIFEKSVIPLLQEYFYDDYQKIQLVLGDNDKTNEKFKFIADEIVKTEKIFNGKKSSVEEMVDLPERKYFINKKAFDLIDSYKEIINTRNSEKNEQTT